MFVGYFRNLELAGVWLLIEKLPLPKKILFDLIHKECFGWIRIVSEILRTVSKSVSKEPESHM